MTPPPEDAPHLETTDRSQGATPARDLLLRAVVGVIAVACLADATGTLAERGLALASPLTAAPEWSELGRLTYWALVWLGACGLLLRRNWGRRLLLATLAIRAIGVGITFARVLPGGGADLFGVVLVLGIGAVFVGMIGALVRARRLTPVPPPPISPARLGAVASVCLFALSIVGATLLLPTVSPPLSSLPRSAEGELEPLLRAGRWRGARVQVIGVRDGRPTTRRVADWDLSIRSLGGGRIQIDGFHFAQNVVVQVDLERNAMLIHETVFRGEPISGRSPLFGDTPFRGVTFSGDGARVHGAASILVLEDGRVVFDFDKVFVDGRRSREYGEVRPVPLPKAPGDPAARPAAEAAVEGSRVRPAEESSSSPGEPRPPGPAPGPELRSTSGPQPTPPGE